MYNLQSQKMSTTITFTFILLVFHSSNSVKLDKEWFKHTIIYEIIPATFKDSDGDGTGDFKGITSKIPHFVDLGVETLHLTPMYSTTLMDMGYDISDFYDVDHRYGTMKDFDELLQELKKKDMKLILDLVINHSGYKNEWFLKSIDRIDPYTDYYVWKNSKGFNNDTQEQIPPNNWNSFFNNWPGSAWKWNEKRKQFYLHQFMEEQPDLNLRNPVLKEELKNMIKFWLDKGVAGFRLDAVPAYIEDELFRDNDNVNNRQIDEDKNIEFVKELRTFLDEYNHKRGGIERIFLPEVHGYMTEVLRFYDNDHSHITQMPYTYYLLYTYGDIDAQDLNMIITSWLKLLPKNAASAWMTEDHDSQRAGDRMRPEYSDILITTAMLLPGTAGLYYGQEIGMVKGYVTENQIKDHLGNGRRDANRLIMQWDNTLNAGFSENIQTYLPANSDYYYRNVEKQKKEKKSHYNLVKTLTKLRKTDVHKHGSFKSYVPSERLFVFTRSHKGKMYIVVINLDVSLVEIKLKDVIEIWPNHISVVATSVNALYPSMYEFDLQFKMSPLSCVVFEAFNS